MRTHFLDNLDSFSWNLVNQLELAGLDVVVFRNGVYDAHSVVDKPAKALVISPGPGSPRESGNLMEVVARAVEVGMPVFGVCLGMQAIGEHFGVPVVRAPQAIHGKASLVEHDGGGLFAGIESPMRCGRYHSLCLDERAIAGSGLVVTGWSDGRVLAHDPTWGNWSDPRVAPPKGVVVGGRGVDERVLGSSEGGRVVMAVRHESLPIWGVQFHPESILTPLGAKICENFAHIVKQRVGGVGVTA